MYIRTCTCLYTALACKSTVMLDTHAQEEKEEGEEEAVKEEEEERKEEQGRYMYQIRRE